MKNNTTYLVAMNERKQVIVHGFVSMTNDVPKQLIVCMHVRLNFHICFYKLLKPLF